MNGSVLSRDHGYPVRVIAPGITGARNVKWVNKIITSKDESQSFWQQNDYKSFSPNIDWNNVDFKKAPAIQESPVQSAITEPKDGASFKNKPEFITVKGYAWSGGGKGIVRVDVSGDGGQEWHTAELINPTEQKPGHAWAWTLWQAKIPLAKDYEGKMNITCKAVDSSYNTQPEALGPIWNLRGVLNNAWHKVNVDIPPDSK